ncbi:MAG: universal stress protein UspA [Thalassolituus sp.]|jgi:nucleotide-binding universal stress UspA family protein|nr:MAG: universal stress protein UspA [Thalassolituus sp.]
MKQITACIDGSHGAEAVCHASAWLSARLQMPLALMHVLEKPESPDTNMSGSIGLGSREHLLQQLTELDEQRSKLALQHGSLMLEAAKELVEGRGAVDVSTVQRHGRLPDAVLEVQEATSVLVMGRQGEDHNDPEVANVGTNFETVLRSVSCPVLVTPGTFPEPKSFMIAYDGSEAAERIMDVYPKSPLLKGLQCHLIMVNADSPQRVKLHSAGDRLREAGFRVHEEHLEGTDVRTTLMRYQAQHKIDLIVMGAYGHSRMRSFFLGSHTRDMVTHTPIPLLLLR